MRVGVVGAGTIGSAVAARLRDGELEDATFVGFLVKSNPEPEGDRLGSIDDFLARAPTVVVEAAGVMAVHECGERVLASGCDLLCLSVGALADRDLVRRLQRAARSAGRSILVPSGAIGALDVISAAAAGGLHEVVVEQRKPPRVLLGERGAAALAEPLTVYDGSVAGAVARYPKSTNVAAAVALAGRGFEQTRARVIADPALTANVAVATAAGSFGRMSLIVENVVSDNPLTSAIVADSVLATLRRRGSGAEIVVPA